MRIGVDVGGANTDAGGEALAQAGAAAAAVDSVMIGAARFANAFVERDNAAAMFASGPTNSMRGAANPPRRRKAVFDGKVVDQRRETMRGFAVGRLTRRRIDGGDDTPFEDLAG